VDPDERGAGALSERLGPPAARAAGRRVAVLLLGGEALCERLEGVKSELPPVFGLDEHSFVVPVREEFLRESGDGLRTGRGRCRSLWRQQPVSQLP
jgi:hypothetical protein